MKVLYSVNDWHRFGIYLGLEMSTLRNIEHEFGSRGLHRIKAEMFDRWLITTPSASWEDLVIALEEMRERMVAHNVAASYCGRPLTTGGQLHVAIIHK